MHPRSTTLILVLVCAGLAQVAAADRAAVVGYRNDGSGVFPDDCRPVDTWQEFEAKPNPDRKARPDLKSLPDPAKPVMKNIVWKTPVPNMSESTPILAGKKLFTMCEPGWPAETDCPMLVCLDADTGRMLWQKPVDQFEALPEAQQAEAKRLRREYWKFTRRKFQLLVERNNAAAANDEAGIAKACDGLTAIGEENWGSKRTGIIKLFANQCGIPKALNPLKALNFITPLWQYTTVGMTFASPCSDGQRVYVTTAYGAAVAFDLDGQRQWVFWAFAPDAKRKPALSLNNNTFSANSPVVAANNLVFRTAGWCFGLDRASGRVVWEHQLQDPVGLKFVVDHVGTAVVLNFNGQDVVLQPRGIAFRASDGKILADPVVPEMRGMAQNTYAVDRATQTVYFGVGGHSGFEVWGEHKFARNRYAVRLALEGDKLTGAMLWNKPGSFGDATAVFWRGKVYSGDFVVNAATGEQAGKHKVDTAQGWVIANGRLWGGTCHDSPYIQSAPIGPDGLVGATTTALIGKLDGFTAEEGARMNAYGGYGIGRWYGWTIGRNYPCFSGNRIFVRTFDCLYCIGEKDQPFVPSKGVEAAR